jgi:hypothetical protein
MWGMSDNYRRYLNQHYRAGDCFVDLASSGRSLKAAVPALGAKNPHLFLLILLDNWKVDLGPIHCASASSHRQAPVDNTYLEMLNYALHRQVNDVDEHGQPIYDEAEEYDFGLARVGHEALEVALQGLPALSGDLAAVVHCAAQRIHDQGTWLESVFPGHIAAEVRRRQRLASRAREGVPRRPHALGAGGYRHR